MLFRCPRRHPRATRRSPPCWRDGSRVPRPASRSIRRGRRNANHGISRGAVHPLRPRPAQRTRRDLRGTQRSHSTRRRHRHRNWPRNRARGLPALPRRDTVGRPIPMDPPGTRRSGPVLGPAARSQDRRSARRPRPHHRSRRDRRSRGHATPSCRRAPACPGRADATERPGCHRHAAGRRTACAAARRRLSHRRSGAGGGHRREHQRGLPRHRFRARRLPRIPPPVRGARRRKRHQRWKRPTPSS